MSICLQASKVDVFIGWCCYCNKAPQTWCREPKFTVSQFCRSATCVSLTGGLRKRKPVCQPGCVLIWGLGILIHQTIFGRLGSCGCRTEALFPRESPRTSLVLLLLSSITRPTGTAFCGLGGTPWLRLAQSLGRQRPCSFFPSLTSIQCSNFPPLTSHLTAAFPEALGVWACRPGNTLCRPHTFH